MLMHSFVLDALAPTDGDTFSHLEELVNEHRDMRMAAASRSANSNSHKDNQQQHRRVMDHGNRD